MKNKMLSHYYKKKTFILGKKLPKESLLHLKYNLIIDNLEKNSLFTQKKQKATDKLTELKNKWQKEDEIKFLSKLKESLIEPIVFHRHTNKKGKFYASVDKNSIINYIRNRIPYGMYIRYRKLSAKHVHINDKITQYGEYSFELKLAKESIPGSIHVKEFLSS
jgi:ribosomal protein L9